MAPEPVYVFAPFRLRPAARLLTAHEMPVKLGGRAFDVLLALVERRERMVSKHELLDIVWPKLVVEENNLQVQVTALRKVLGHHAVATIPGRGYRFTMPVTVEGAGAPAAVADGANRAPAIADDVPAFVGTPRSAMPLFGRDDDVAAIGAALRGHRVVTIVGAGGIGKTRVAEAAAAAVRAEFADGVGWVELASITEPDRVVTTVARSLGLAVAFGGGSRLSGVLGQIADRSMLIVLDNCEHLLEGVAAFVAAAMPAAPGLRVLVTSQELIKVGDERVYRLGTLGLPAGDDAAAVEASGSGSLLLARVGAAAPGFALTAANAPAAAEICRSLDGIPLAIELAAARVPLLGLEGVRGLLGERFRMLTAGARVVLRRHQTLRAALEWSHALLSPEERVVFRRLGVFVGGFTLESAQRVADDDEIDAWDVLEHLGALVDKSLVLAEGEPVPRYRLLETTRLYALEQLAAAGETEASTLKHAQAIRTLLAAIEAPERWFRMPLADFSAFAAELDNTRVALDWAAHRDDQAVLRLDLASLSSYVFMMAEVIDEGLQRLLAFRRHATPDLPDAVRARFQLALARIGTQMAHVASLDAAQLAAGLYAGLGEPARRYAALACAIAIGARVDLDVDAARWIADAAALENAAFPPRLVAHFEWARHRWLLREGKADEALLHARRQVELVRASGAENIACIIEAANVGYCELAAGRAGAARALAESAIAAAGGTGRGDGHALDTLSMSLAAVGEFDEALRVARVAYADLLLSGDDFMLLDGLAWIAAATGRPRDALIAAALSDAEFAARRFLRWPLSVEWRRRADALLAEVAPADRERWTREAAALSRTAAFDRALGL